MVYVFLPEDALWNTCSRPGQVMWDKWCDWYGAWHQETCPITEKEENKHITYFRGHDYRMHQCTKWESTFYPCRHRCWWIYLHKPRDWGWALKAPGYSQSSRFCRWSGERPGWRGSSDQKTVNLCVSQWRGKTSTLGQGKGYDCLLV